MYLRRFADAIRALCFDIDDGLPRGRGIAGYLSGLKDFRQCFRSGQVFGLAGQYVALQRSSARHIADTGKHRRPVKPF